MNNIPGDYRPTESHYFHTVVQGQIKGAQWAVTVNLMVSYTV